MRILLFILCLMLAPLPALAEKSIDDVADSWVKDEIGREPYTIDNWLTAPKDLIVGRQVSDTMGGILGRIKDRMNEEEGSFGKPNRRRGPCGAAAVRQASGIAADSGYSQIFRAIAGNTVEVFGAIPGLIAKTARFLGEKALEEVEKAVRDHFRTQSPEEYTLSKSQEGCSLEMRVIWKKDEEKYKFMILGDCGCNRVRCWNFEDREIPLGRFSVMGEGSVVPRVTQKADGTKEIQFVVGRITSLQVRADCCGEGQTGAQLDADPYWVNLMPDGTSAAPTTPRPTTGGGSSRPVTGTSGSSGGTAVTPPATPQPQPINPNDPAGIGVRPPEMTEPVNVPNVPEGPLCEAEKNALIDAAFAEEHKANRNAQLAANYVVDLAFAGGHHPEAPQRLRDELQKWSTIRDRWIRTADAITNARKALQALAVKPCPPPAGGAGTTGAVGGGTGTTGSDGASGQSQPKQEKCPECVPIRQQLENAKAEKKKAEDELKQKRQALTPLNNEIEQARERVERARKPLSGERGVGGESTDTETGITTSSYDTGDGRVRIAVTDKDGNVIDERFRVRSSSADRRAQLERAEEALQQLLDRKAELESQIQTLEQAIVKLSKQIAELEKALEECLKKCNRLPAKADTGVSIELEDAHSVDGTNPLDAHSVGHLGPQDNNKVIRDLPPVTPKPVAQPQPIPVPYPAETPKPAVQVGQTPPAAAPPPLSVSHSGVIGFTHTVGESPCPQPAGSVTLRAASGHVLEISPPSVGGTLSSRLNLSVSGNNTAAPVIDAQFNCSSPANGSFSGNVQATVRDTATGETTTVTVPASGSVNGG